ASSFRLAHSQRFAPRVGTWLNFAPDHLDRHRSMASYEEAKARIWRDQTADDVAVGSADDPVVLDHLRRATAQQVTFGLHGDAAFRLDGVRLVGEGAGELATVDELWRAFPHDIVNALAAAATALAAGGTVAGVHDALTAFRGLPHRIELVARHDGISWYDDSKATTPNAAAAAIRSLPSVVLIAGGQNKGLDLAPLAREGDHVRAVVAIGEAADEVVRAFEHVCPTTVATSMAEAVASARDL